MAPFNVLFLCTGNSARSIMAEALLNYRGAGQFHAYSAGSQPRGEVHPLALETLRRNQIPVDGLRSKGFEEFERADAPEMHFVFTVCDQAAEACPVWPGHPMTAHWGIRDPSETVGSPDQRQRDFTRAFWEIDARIKIFVSLPIASLDLLALQQQLDAIGGTPTAS